jgi:hypothetical protein
MGASIAKWTAPNPYPVFSDSDLKPYTNIEFCEEKIMHVFKTYWSTKPSKL